MQVSITIYPDSPEEEFEFVVKADVDLGSPGRRFGPPELCSPPDPVSVDWLSFRGEGFSTNDRDTFDAWLAAKGASVNWTSVEDELVEKAGEEVDCDDDAWEFEPYRDEGAPF